MGRTKAVSSVFFDNLDCKLRAVKKLRGLNVWGDVVPPLPCDDLKSWRGEESCKVCPAPCVDPCIEKESEKSE
jgi:hypothetical protein